MLCTVVLIADNMSSEDMFSELDPDSLTQESEVESQPLTGTEFESSETSSCPSIHEVGKHACEL